MLSVEGPMPRLTGTVTMPGLMRCASAQMPASPERNTPGTFTSAAA